MYSFINRLSTKKNLIAGLLLIVIINLVVFPFFPALLDGSDIDFSNIFDLQFGFNTAYVIQTLTNLGQKGRHIYMLSTIFVDIPYLIIYGFVYAILINTVLHKLQFDFKLLIYLSFLISLFDLIENIGVIYFLQTYPDISLQMVKLTSIANQLKWLTVFVLFCCFIILLIILMYKSYSKSSKK